MRYFIIAGEASGDLHGSGLVRALMRMDDMALIEGWGGDRMEQAGASIRKHYRELDYMGFIEVARNIFKILGNFRTVKRQIGEFQPDALILIDYPGFNLRIAKWAASRGIPVHYYISPQLWAWKENRIETIRACVSKMYVILPFEKEYYSKRGIDVSFVGHPLLEAIEAFRNAKSKNSDLEDRRIAILAGSRLQEIQHMLPVMVRVASTFTDYQFIIAAPSHVDRSVYEKVLHRVGAPNISIRSGQTYDVLDGALAAMTTSGTATLETALFNVPQVVCYKGSQLSFAIAKRLVRVPFISLVNLIAGKPVVEELLQDNVNPSKLSAALQSLFTAEIRDTMLDEYSVLRAKLDKGGASERVAEQIVRSLRN